MTRIRLTPGRLSQLVDRLDERDLAIVATLRTTRMATGDQLRRIHFAGSSPRDRQARRALARLVELGVLARLERSIGGRRAGSAGFIYSLGVVGQQLGDRVGPSGGIRLRQPWTPSLPFVRHVLAGTELLAQLREAERAGQLELIEFASEPACWRRFFGPSGVIETLKPDALVRVALGDFEDAYFIENDLATESPAVLERKLARYRAYYASGMEQRATGVFPRVLWIVPHDRRAQVVVDTCGRQPADSWHLFGVVTHELAVERIAAGLPS